MSTKHNKLDASVVNNAAAKRVKDLHILRDSQRLLDSQRPLDSLSADQRTLFDKIVRLASYRERSCCELRQRLLKDGNSIHDVDAALDYACTCGIVDDTRFAEMLVKSRMEQGKAIAGIKRELSKHQLEHIDVDQLIDSEGSTACSEEQRAQRLLATQHFYAKNKRQAAFRKLIASGYSNDIAYRVSKWYEDTYAPTDPRG